MAQQQHQSNGQQNKQHLIDDKAAGEPGEKGE